MRTTYPIILIQNIPVRRLFLLLLFSCYTFIVQAQNVRVGSNEDMLARSLQLAGKIDSNISFTVRPLQAVIDTSLRTSRTLIKFPGNGVVAVLPVSFIQQFNSHHPYGWNDGAMIAAKGYQTMVSAGLYAKWGPVEVQARPEFVFAANPAYETTVDYGSATRSFQKFYPGQSSVKIGNKAIAVGLSTQNLWWGPGQYSSLLMSNNAPGFLHGFFGTNRPIKTPIGSFEWQVIGAKITAKSGLAYENFNLKTAPFSGSRYLNAYVISYQPKWVPGLFLGMTRGLQRYRADIDRSGQSLLSKYMPVLFKAFQKQNAQADDTMRTDQLASFFLRWVLPKAKTEFYIEYGFNDYNQNVRDYLLGPTHSAAYLVGAKKIIDLDNKTFLDFNLELTQMSQSPEAILREAGNWYVHGEIREGYTNDNQILGAGAGLGCNVQTFSASWVRGVKKLGVMFERVDRDPQYHANKWVDFGIGFLPQLQYGNFLFSGKFMFINSSQYAWQKDVNRFNLHSRIAVQYSF